MKKAVLLFITIVFHLFAFAQCWQSVAAGKIHSGAIKSNGTLWMWGWNNDGQLGNSTNSPSSIPMQIGVENNWLKLAVSENAVIADGTGGKHSMAIKTDGTLWAWGLNTFGQLGNNSIISINEPTKIGNDTIWKDVALGPHHTLAIKTDGTLWAWGNNQYGQLGINSTTDAHVPTQIGTDTDWDKIATGSQHCLAIKTNGTLWSWGRNNYYQLGFFNDNTNKLIPTKIGSDTDWANITVGGDFSFATKTNNTLWGWGRNDYGQLGLGNNSSYHPIPEQIGTQTNWAKIDAGNSHMLAIKLDESVWGWGYNYDGELAQGNNTFMITSPVQLSSLSNIKYISSGGYCGMSIDNNGELKTWGYNDGGLLGTGNFNNSNLPILINCPAPVVLPIHNSGDSTIFNMVHEVWDYSWTDLVLISGDTAAKSQAYNNVYYKEQFSSQFELAGHIRQDSTNTRAWYKSIEDTSEYLIMDLNLNIGDTFVVRFSTPTNAIVTNVDTINGRKRIVLDYLYGGGFINEYLTFIEGIGPNASFFFQSDNKTTPVDYLFGFLPCSKQINGTSVFHYFPDDIDCSNSLTAVSSIKNNSQLSIYPNPVKDVLRIETTEQIEQISIYNINGSLVRTINNEQNGWINVAGLSKGMYFMTIKTETRITQSKFIKE
ncbi:MAG: T9SS type A sorting domain-containing protein [Flavobacteriales bacterium]|nr:T9SS type A sorting domain-containing protein [Flavobacteriales bacterium]